MRYIKMYQDINNLFISTNESKMVTSATIASVDKFEEVSENFNKLIPKDWEIKSDIINPPLRRVVSSSTRTIRFKSKSTELNFELHFNSTSIRICWLDLLGEEESAWDRDDYAYKTYPIKSPDVILNLEKYIEGAKNKKEIVEKRLDFFSQYDGEEIRLIFGDLEDLESVIGISISKYIVGDNFGFRFTLEYRVEITNLDSYTYPMELYELLNAISKGLKSRKISLQIIEQAERSFSINIIKGFIVPDSDFNYL